MAHPFEKLTASDVMQTEIVTVEVTDNLLAALDLMTEHHVSGLPVVDAENCCLGLISASDILNYEQEHIVHSGEEAEKTAPYYNVEAGKWEDIRVSSFALEQRGDTPVEDIMTRKIISVSPETPIAKVAATMTANEVHRVIVLETGRQVCGLVSAVDFVQLIADLVD